SVFFFQAEVGIRDDLVTGVQTCALPILMGEELNRADVTQGGLAGDRAYALVDKCDGKVATAKNPRKWPQLFDFRAAVADVPRAEIGRASCRARGEVSGG